MKINYITLAVGVLFFFLTLACKEEFLDIEPFGSVGETTLSTKAGVDGVLIGAYSLLDQGGTVGGGYTTGLSAFTGNDEFNRGTESGGSVINTFLINSSMAEFNNKWQFLYAAVNRCNDVLKLLPNVKDATAEQLVQLEAEAKFLRGVYYLYLAMMWGNVPWIDETIDYSARNYFVPNTADIYPRIEADFAFAADNLTETKAEAGRANSWAAKSFLAKTYMFQKKFSDAQVLLDDIILNGRTARNQKYGLLAEYGDNFKVATKNSQEAVFSAQNSVNDGANGANGNPGEFYNGTFGGPSTCCYGWTQPSFDFVDAFQTDEAGLPLPDTYHLTPIPNDQGIASDEPFTPYAGNLDPRLDWTVGRRGIPYLDWGVMPGRSWIRNQFVAGPYASIKQAATQAGVDQEREAGYATSTPYDLIRFADVLLWAAECEIEVGSLAKAEEYVNVVRARAANPEGFVYQYLDESNPTSGYSTTPAANYKVGLYNGHFTANGQSFARKAVRFERKLELGLEFHRFFDMRRYDGNDFDQAEVHNAYMAREGARPLTPNTNYKVGRFIKGTHELYPIPLNQIELMETDGASVLVQNPGY